MEDQKKFMEAAIELADNNIESLHGGPFGAIVVKNGKIVGRGSNQVTVSNDPTAHAEVTAIRDACRNLGTFDLSGCEIYTSCEPCPMCLGAIYWSNLETLYYAATKDDAADADFDDSFIYKEFELPKDKRSIPSVQISRDKALAVFDKWVASENKIPY